jgi:hypothetical protein
LNIDTLAYEGQIRTSAQWPSQRTPGTKPTAGEREANYLDERNGLDTLSVIVKLSLETSASLLYKLEPQKVRMLSVSRALMVLAYDIANLLRQDKDEGRRILDRLCQIGYSNRRTLLAGRLYRIG